MKEKTALIFPGGGMTLAFDSVVSDFYQRIEHEIGTDVRQILKSDSLSVTYAPLLINIMNLAWYAKLAERLPDYKWDATAGLSAGQTTAMVVSGAIEQRYAFYLLKKVCEFIHEIPLEDRGILYSMVYTATFDDSILNEENGVYVAVDAKKGRITIGGKQSVIEAFVREHDKQNGIKLYPLDKIEGAYHTPCITDPAHGVRAIVYEDKSNRYFHKTRIPIIVNTSGSYIREIHEIKNEIWSQLPQKVRWQDSLRFMHHDMEIDAYVVVGPDEAETIRKTILSVAPNARVSAVKDQASLDSLLDKIAS